MAAWEPFSSRALAFVEKQADAKAKLIPQLKKDGSGDFDYANYKGINGVDGPTSARLLFPSAVEPFPDPCLAWNRSITADSTATLLDPELFALSHATIYYCAPHRFFGIKPKCPCCKEDTDVTPNGWSSKVRRVAALTGLYLVKGHKYKCKDCPGARK